MGRLFLRALSPLVAVLALSCPVGALAEVPKIALASEIKDVVADQRYVFVSPDGKYLVVGGTGDRPRLALWDVAAGKNVAIPEDAARDGKGVLSADDAFLATTGFGSLDIYNIKTGKVDHKLKVEGFAGCNAMAFSPDGKVFYAVFGKKLTAWDLAKDEVKFSLDAGATEVRSFAISPDGKMIAAVGEDVTMKLIDTATGKATKEVTISDADPSDKKVRPTDNVAFSPDGKLIGAANTQPKIRIYDIAADKVVTTMSSAHSLQFGLAFTADSAGIIHSYRILDMTDQPTAMLAMPDYAWCISMSYSAATSTLYTISDDGVIKVWKLAQK